MKNETKNSHTTITILRLPEFCEASLWEFCESQEEFDAVVGKIDAVMAEFGFTFYPATAEVIAPLDAEFEVYYGSREKLVEKINDAIA